MRSVVVGGRDSLLNLDKDVVKAWREGSGLGSRGGEEVRRVSKEAREVRRRWRGG